MIWPNIVHLQKIMLQGSHDLRTSKIYTTAQASKFYTRTIMAHNNVSSVNKYSPVAITHYRKNNPSSPLYGQ